MLNFVVYFIYFLLNFLQEEFYYFLYSNNLLLLFCSFFVVILFLKIKMKKKGIKINIESEVFRVNLEKGKVFNFFLRYEIVSFGIIDVYLEEWCVIFVFMVSN